MPTLEASYFEYADDIGASLTTLVSPVIDVVVEDWIIVKYIHRDADSLSSTTCTGDTVTFGTAWIAQFSDYCEAMIWAGPVTATGTVTVTVDPTGAPGRPHSMVVERWSSAYVSALYEFALWPAGTGAPSLTISTTSDDSVVTWVSGDKDADDGAGRTYDTTSATPVEEQYHRFTGGTSAQNYTCYFAYQATDASGTQIFGLTAPAAQNFSMAAIEIIHKEGTIIREGTGGKANTGTTTIAPAYPGVAVAADRLAVAVRGQKPETSTATTETDWDRQLSATGGTGSQGNGTGPTRVTVDTQVLVGSESGSVTFDQASSPNSVIAAIAIYSCNAGYTWELASTTGDDTAHGTGRNATGGAGLALAPGDVVLAISSSDDDAATAYTVPAITASSITFGSTANLFGGNATTRGGSTTGNDSNILWFQATVTAGTATSAPVFAATGGPSTCGPVAFLRLREVPGSVGATATPAVIARVVALPAAAASAATDATATPAVTARVVGVPAATLKAGSAASPAAIARTVALPASTRTAGSTPTPAVIARTAVVPAPAAGAGAAASPAVVARTAVVPAPTVAAGAAPTPAAIARAAVLPTVTRVAGSTTSPAAIVRTVAVNAPTLSAGAVPTPATIAQVAVLPDVSASGTGVGTAAPNVIATSVTLPAATETGAGNVTPAVIPVTVAVPVAAPRAGAVTSPARILCAVGIPAATASSVTDATVTPAAIAAAAAALAPNLTAGSAATPTVITLTIAVYTPTVAGGIPDEHTRRYTHPYREVTVAVWREPAGTLTYREHP